MSSAAGLSGAFIQGDHKIQMEKQFSTNGRFDSTNTPPRLYFSHIGFKNTPILITI